MKLKTLVAVGLFAAMNCANAQDMYFSGRVGPTLGMYKQEATIGFSNAGTGLNARDSFDSDWETAYGLQTGVTAAYGDFFADLAVEFLAVDADADLDRTDVLFSLGYLIGQHWSAFAGYRKGMQGDGFFDDETFSEDGFFLGAGLGGLPAGDLVLGASLAYNFSEAKDFPTNGQKFDYGGISLKLSGQLKSMPQHSLQLRYQRFNGDSTQRQFVDIDQDGSLDDLFIDLTESYFQLTYLYSF